MILKTPWPPQAEILGGEVILLTAVRSLSRTLRLRVRTLCHAGGLAAGDMPLAQSVAGAAATSVRNVFVFLLLCFVMSVPATCHVAWLEVRSHEHQ